MTHSARYSIITGGKKSERKANHSPQTVTKLGKHGAILPLLHMLSCFGSELSARAGVGEVC
jgi:GMP synthase-like glutamine amidotransferase